MLYDFIYLRQDFYYVAQAVFELRILVPQPPECNMLDFQEWRTKEFLGILDNALRHWVH